MNFNNLLWTSKSLFSNSISILSLFPLIISYKIRLISLLIIFPDILKLLPTCVYPLRILVFSILSRYTCFLKGK